MSAYDGFLSVPSWVDSPYAGTHRVDDLSLPTAEAGVPLHVVVTGGAGQVAGPVGLCVRRSLSMVAIETVLRDDADPGSNARRVVAAADAAGLPDGAALVVGVAGEPTPGWLAAADEVAAYEGALSLDLTAGPAAVTAWIDAALDRELPFHLRGGSLDDALEALTATARLWGDESDLTAARRWCRAWAVSADDLDGAASQLQALDAASG